MHQGQHDGTEAGAATMLYIGAIVGVLLRGATWVFSSLTIGPLLGVIDTLAGDYTDRRELLFVQAVVTVVAVLVATLGGLGLQMDPGRYRLPVRLLCGIFILDALVYLAPLVYAAAMTAVELTTFAWVVFGVTIVGNLGLVGLSLLIIIRTRRQPVVAPQPAQVIVIS